MSNADQKIGLMDGAYFVGRKEVLDWINGTLDLSYTKIEQTASGAVACQLLDSMYPGKVPIHKVNWAAKHEHEFTKNYKVLQMCFNKLKIDKHIEVDRLVRAKYQDNLEFMQWFKRFYELNSNESSDYDARAQRAKGQGGEKLNKASGAKPDAKALLAAASGTHKRKQARGGKPAAGSMDVKLANREDDPREATTQKENLSVNKSRSSQQSAKSRAAMRAKAAKGAKAASSGKVKELEQMNAELRLTVDGLERERDFYFGKLRDIEILLQSQEGEAAEGEAETPQAEMVQRIFKILYATEDDFQAEAGEDAPDTTEASSAVVAPEEMVAAPVAVPAN